MVEVKFYDSVDDSLLKGMYMDSLIKKVSQKDQERPQVEDNENE